MDKKLNNLIEFKNFKLDKLENKPGKVVESLNNIKKFNDLVDEGFFTDTKIGNKIRKGAGFKTYEEKFEETEERILKHPVKRKIYLKYKDEDPNKAKKYIEFFIDNPRGYPKWNGTEWEDTASYSHELGSDIGSPKTGYY